MRLHELKINTANSANKVRYIFERLPIMNYLKILKSKVELTEITPVKNTWRYQSVPVWKTPRLIRVKKTDQPLAMKIIQCTVQKKFPIKNFYSKCERIFCGFGQIHWKTSFFVQWWIGKYYYWKLILTHFMPLAFFYTPRKH